MLVTRPAAPGGQVVTRLSLVSCANREPIVARHSTHGPNRRSTMAPGVEQNEKQCRSP
jgi:hypothetical protein